MLQANVIKRASWIFVVAGLLAMVVLPAAAQNPAPANNTITVTGTGGATASPDMATIEIGVEVPNTDIATAYSEVNATIEGIINAMVELGVARADIRTTGINIYSEGMPDPDGQMQNRYRVGNRVQVTVRDLSLVETVIDTAVNSGANMIFGLQFGINDKSTLESEARSQALEDARNRAGEIAENIGVELGNIVGVVEMSGGFYPMYDGYGGGAGNAVVEPGQLTVNMQMQVTFEMNR